MTDPHQLRTILERVASDALSDVYTCFPARVIYYDSQFGRVDVEPVPVQDLLSPTGTRYIGPWTDGKPPKLVNLPVMFPRSGEFAVTFPVVVGTWVLVMCMDEDALQWRPSGYDPAASREVVDRQALQDTASDIHIAVPASKPLPWKPTPDPAKGEVSDIEGGIPEDTKGPATKTVQGERFVYWMDGFDGAVAIPGWYPPSQSLDAAQGHPEHMVVGDVVNDMTIRFQEEGILLGGYEAVHPVALGHLVTFAIEQAIKSHTHTYVDANNTAKVTGKGTFPESYVVPDSSAKYVRCR